MHDRVTICGGVLGGHPRLVADEILAQSVANCRSTWRWRDRSRAKIEPHIEPRWDDAGGAIGKVPPTGVVSKNMQGLGAKLRKLPGQAKICTPPGGEVIAKICVLRSKDLYSRIDFATDASYVDHFFLCAA